VFVSFSILTGTSRHGLVVLILGTGTVEKIEGISIAE